MGDLEAKLIEAAAWPGARYKLIRNGRVFSMDDISPNSANLRSGDKYQR